MTLRGNQRVFKAAVFGVSSALLLTASSLFAAAGERVTAVFAPAGAGYTVAPSSAPVSYGQALPTGIVINGDGSVFSMATPDRPAPRRATARASGKSMQRKRRATAIIRNAEVKMDPVAASAALRGDEQDDKRASEQPLVEAVATRGGRELDCLTRAIYFEARGESTVGQEAVAQVILARQRTRGRPNTICGVVYEGSHRSTGCQFSFTCDSVSDYKIQDRGAWSRAFNVASLAIAGKVRTAADGATFYHANYVRPRWAASMVKVATIGTHIFYRP